VTEEIVEYGVPVDPYVNAEIPMVVTLFGIVIEDKNFVESRKAFSPIFTIPSFNVSEVKASRSWKALTGIEVTVPGIDKEVSFFAERKAILPIVVRPLFKVRVVKLSMSLNASAPIVVTFPGIFSEVTPKS
jgi:hypothetical protein